MKHQVCEPQIRPGLLSVSVQGEITEKISTGKAPPLPLPGIKEEVAAPSQEARLQKALQDARLLGKLRRGRSKWAAQERSLRLKAFELSDEDARLYAQVLLLVL